MGASDERRGRGLKSWSTRDLLVVAAISVALGLVQIPLVYAATFLIALGPLAFATIGGLFHTPFMMALYVTRRPGAPLVCGLLVGGIQALLTPFGWLAFLQTVPASLGCEMPFLLTRYRNFRLPVILVGGALTGLVLWAIYYVPYGVIDLLPAVQVGLFVTAATSGALLCGLLAKLLSDELAKTGVLSAYAVGRQRREVG